MNFCYLKIINILYSRYHPKIIVHVLKNQQKSKFVCIHDIIQAAIMKMTMKIKNSSHKYELIKPSSRCGHKYSKYKKSQYDGYMY